ncbi:DUF6612 family protein [Halalkalibacter kiskunsagensis]|uniref:DUF6612 family protein n=1 Tax=Halalkalibacter kiskunsagensis TaxID=1548599 RepID=A0ABV6K9G1_9BACI
MDKFKKGIVALCISALLAACNETEPVITQQEEEPTVEEIKENTRDGLSVTDILQQSINVMENIESLSSNLDVTQELIFPNEESYVATSTLYIEMIQKPLVMYQRNVMDVPEMGKLETELYMVEDGVYYKDAIEDVWFTYPEDFTQELRGLDETQMSPAEQLELLTRHTDYLAYSEDDTHYILTIKGSNDSLQIFAEEINDLVLDEMTTDIEQLMTVASIQDIDYELYIEKETFIQTEMKMKMSLQLEIKEELVEIQSTIHATFDHFNDISSIIVPPVIVENAEEYNPYADLDNLEDLEELEEGTTE